MFYIFIFRFFPSLSLQFNVCNEGKEFFFYVFVISIREEMEKLFQIYIYIQHREHVHIFKTLFDKVVSQLFGFILNMEFLMI